MGRATWSHLDHKVTLKQAREAAKLSSIKDAEIIRTDLLREGRMTKKDARIVGRGGKTGGWLTVLPNVMNGSILSDLEFRDGLRLRYAMPLQNLPTHCDGCNAKCNIDHALNCKKGGLVIARHNEVKDELGFLATLATSPNAVRDEPFIFPGRAANGESNCESNSCPHVQSPTNNEGDRGDLLLRGIWERQTHCVVDVRIANVDSGSYLTSTPEKVLCRQETEKKKKYLQACLDQRRNFTPFVSSTDGLMGREATALVKRLASMTASRWRTTYSKVCGYFKARMSIAVLRATHSCLRGSRVPAKNISSKIFMHIEDGAGLGLMHYAY